MVDTPGQIEIFTWSASGQIITEALATRFPTALLYIVDTPRSINPTTFMSNMLYAVSILYKMKVPFLLIFNKTDLQSHQFAVDWMKDFEAFIEALDKGSNETATDSVDENNEGERDTYMNSLMNSMALVLDEFYSTLQSCGVSSLTGNGFDELLARVEDCRTEYIEDYLPDLQQQQTNSATKNLKNKKPANPSSSHQTKEESLPIEDPKLSEQIEETILDSSIKRMQL